MPLGSLESQLYGPNGPSEELDWSTRMKIAAGVAKGLNYLHNESRAPHVFGDLKSSNILLDVGFHPKLADFRLPANVYGGLEICPAETSTEGYTAPEFASTGRHSIETDIYNFGIVMFELISGCRPTDMIQANGKHKLISWARVWVTDPKEVDILPEVRLEGNVSMDSLKEAVELALFCVGDDPESRFNMKDVVEILNGMVFLNAVDDEQTTDESDVVEDDDDEQTTDESDVVEDDDDEQTTDESDVVEEEDDDDEQTTDGSDVVEDDDDEQTTDESDVVEDDDDETRLLRRPLFTRMDE